MSCRLGLGLYVFTLPRHHILETAQLLLIEYILLHQKWYQASKSYSIKDWKNLNVCSLDAREHQSNPCKVYKVITEIKSNPRPTLTFEDEESDVKEIVPLKIEELESKMIVCGFKKSHFTKANKPEIFT